MAEEPSFSVSNLHPADRILLGGSLLLVIDSFLPWQRIFGLSLNAWGGTASWTGKLMGLCAIALVLWSAAGAAGITAGAGETGEKVGAVLVGATVGFGLLKFMLTAFNHGYLFAWTGLFCLLAIAYGGYMRLQEPKAVPGARAPGHQAPPDGPVPPKRPPPPPGTGGFLP
jgi:hypothetical protein